MPLAKIIFPQSLLLICSEGMLECLISHLDLSNTETTQVRNVSSCLLIASELSRHSWQPLWVVLWKPPKHSWSNQTLLPYLMGLFFKQWGVQWHSSWWLREFWQKKKPYTQDAEMYTHTPRKRLHIHTHSLAQYGSLVY